MGVTGALHRSTKDKSEEKRTPAKKGENGMTVRWTRYVRKEACLRFVLSQKRDAGLGGKEKITSLHWGNHFGGNAESGAQRPIRNHPATRRKKKITWTYEGWWVTAKFIVGNLCFQKFSKNSLGEKKKIEKCHMRKKSTTGP